MYLIAGVAYINWGEDTCPGQASTLYAGSAVTTQGPGATVQCLDDAVLLNSFNVPPQQINTLRTMAYTDNLNAAHLPVRCAMCYAPTKSTKFLNLGASTCPANWSLEFEGTLATQHNQLFSDMVCINNNLVPNIQWSGNNDFDLVEPECMSGKKCLNGQVACALCTR